MKGRSYLYVICLFSLLVIMPWQMSARRSIEEHVAFLTSDSLAGRAAGSAGELAAANYIYATLQESGVTLLSPPGGDDFYMALSEGDTLHSRNIIGIVEGYDSSLKNEYVVIGAHIDHLGANILTVDGKSQQQVYRGADDNASGVAALLEIAGKVANDAFLFRRSVIFAFFGAQERGMAGSWYFLNRLFKDTSDIVMMINLDMVGRSGGENDFRIYTGLRNLELAAVIDDVSASFPGLSPKVYPTDCFASDHRSFYHKGIPVALLTSGLHRDYHTLRDTPDKLDYGQIYQISNYAYELAMSVANADKRVSSGIHSTTSDTQGGYYSQSDVDRPAQFLHGTEAQFLSRWVYPYVKYPDSAVAAGEQGKVIAEFIIEEDGSVSNVTITRGVTEDIDNEVIKVISASPKWKPARLQGRNVRVKTSVAVEFRLSKTYEFGIKK